MTKNSLSRVWALALLLCLCRGVTVVPCAQAQTDQTTEAQLVGKAHALELRGRPDLAMQVWQQLLNGNRNQPDALAGMARANKLEGHSREAQEYLDRLRAVRPGDPEIARIEMMGTAKDQSARLQEAGRLAQAGQYARAMMIFREVYGTDPPSGDPALAYYQTEAATEDGRPHAIAGLRALADRYPNDPRYQITLGKILTYNPRTRAEGRKLLEKNRTDPDADQALKMAQGWDQPTGVADNRIPDEGTAVPLSGLPAPIGSVRARSAVPRPAEVTMQPPQIVGRGRSSEEQRAYAALNSNRLEEAERLFRALLDRNPHNSQAAAGMGYLRMNQSNFGGAISFFEEAEGDGDRSPALEKALHDSRFFYLMQTATAALNGNNLPVAEQEFRAALMMRPDNAQALQGLGGTLLKGQQNEHAIEVFNTLVRVSPGEVAGWRGLIMADTAAGRYADALDAERRTLPQVKVALQRDPDYLQAMATTYLSLGREADAQRVLRAALELPFPPNGMGLKVAEQLQYAALLSTAGRKEQSIGLYRQVLTREPGNVNAWIGLVQNQHQTGNDAAALESIKTIPPDTYRGAMQEAGFETTVAAVYEGQGNDALAQRVLEQLLVTQQSQGKQAFPPAQVQLASLYMRHGNSTQAYALYRVLIERNPQNAQAWAGLLGALHATQHDQEAMAQLQTIPPDVRRELEDNPIFLATVSSIYASLGDPNTALQFFGRVQEHYSSLNMPLPADLEVQEAWLLHNAHSDQALLAHLLKLGDRKDLTDQQRTTLQTIWANFAVRRANQASAAGNYRLSLAILNAAAQTFPNNKEVLRDLAGGYVAAGMPKEAVAIFKSQDMNSASAADYRAAVGAALAANDMRDAELWLRFGLIQNPHDAQLLILAAKFEAVRGDAKRAAEYYKAALAATRPGNPGAGLAAEMAKPIPLPVSGLPSRNQPQNLASLLAQPDSAGTPRRQAIQPFLPSYSGGTGAMPALGGSPAGSSGATGAPDMGGYSPIVPQAQPVAPVTGGKRPSTLNDYKPQARLESPAAGERHLHADKAMEARYGPYMAYDPAQGVREFVGFNRELGDGVATSGDARSTTAVVRSAAFQVTGTQQSKPQPATGVDPAGYPQQSGTGAQQYPQPRVQAAPVRTHKQPAPKKTAPNANTPPTPSPASPETQPEQPQQAPMQYPVPSPPTENYGAPQSGAASPLGQAPNDYQLQQQNLPPLRGYYDPRTDPDRPMSTRESAQLGLAQIEGSYSGWAGGSAIGRYRSGTPGVDRLASLKVPFEASFVVDKDFRLSIIPQAVFLNSGQLNTNGGTLSTGPILGTYLGSAPNDPAQQFANGIGFEAQLAANTFSIAVGATPYEFLVTNLIGRGRWRPANGHFTIFGGRDAVEETQLSYAGLRDPGSASTTYAGNVWGGVVQTGGGVRFDYGDERSGLYLQGEGAALTGYHVLQNQKYDGLMGAYFQVKKWADAGVLNVGGLFYGMHFTYNERGETYGLGGYFSPNAYFLATLPVTFSGYYGTDLHYTISGSLGVQTFQEENETYFPLDTSLLAVAGCTAEQFINHTCGLPVNSNTGLNFSFDSEVSYRASDHWYVGGFLSANNTNNYETVTGGFFARYTFRPQFPTVDAPTGLFPVQGLRPLRVP